MFACAVEDLFALDTPRAGTPDWAWEPPQDVCRYWLAEVRGRLQGLVGEDPDAIPECHRRFAASAPPLAT